MKITDLKIAIARRKLLTFGKRSIVDGRICKLGLILDISSYDSLDAFIRFKETLGLEEDDVPVVIVGKKEDQNGTFEYPVIFLSDFGWTGSISEELSAFLDAQFDVLISFTAEENKMADLLVSVIRARLKVGRKKEDKKGIFDLNISAELSEPEIFTQELRNYLKILNTTIAT